MKTKLEYSNYSKAEKEARDKAVEKGFNIPESYGLPYSLEEHSKVAAVLKNWPLHRVYFEDLKRSFYESEFTEMPKRFWRVLCEDEVPMSDWFADKKLARKEMEMFNVRHFTAIGMSENKNKPVLI